MENSIIRNYGFKPSWVDKEKHYILGDASLPIEIIMPGGHGWKYFLPSDEFQSRGDLETFNCTAFGSLHAVVTLGKKKFGATFQNNLSERFLGRVAGTTQYGNDPHKVAEAIRSFGVIPDVFLPFDASITTLQQYYPRFIYYWMWATGQHWINQAYNFGHDWVFLPTDTQAIKIAKLKTALQYSPLGISVFAWSQHTDGLYYSDQDFQNHWVTLYDYEDGKNWKIFDSYDQTHKLLDFNFTFGQAKRYTLSKKQLGEIGNVNPLSYLPFYLGSLLS